MTSGDRCIWKEVLLHEARLDDGVKVIGGSRLSDVVMINPDVKSGIVTRLLGRYGVRAYAFGDSEVDVPMLKAAAKSILSWEVWKRELK